MAVLEPSDDVFHFYRAEREIVADFRRVDDGINRFVLSLFDPGQIEREGLAFADDLASRREPEYGAHAAQTALVA